MENNMVVNGNCKEMIKDVLFQETCEWNVEKDRKVLSVTAVSVVSGFETLEKELRVSVRTTFRIITCDEEGNYDTEKGENETIKSIIAENITPTTKVCVNARVTDCETVSSVPLKARATVELTGWFVKTDEITFLSTENADLYCKTEKSPIENIVPLSDSTVALSYTDEARMPVSKILDYSGWVSVDNVYPSAGTYRADGDIGLRIVAIADNGQFITQNFSHAFSAENAEEFVTGEMKLDVEGFLKNLTFSVNESDKRIIVCDAVVKLCGVALEEKEVEKAVDVYSVKNELEIVKEKKTVNTHFCARSVREKAMATVSANGGVSEILGVVTPAVSVSGVLNGDGITVDGVISTTVMYLDEQRKAHSVACDVPFVSNVGGEYLCETVFSPEVNVTMVNARPRGSSDVEVTAEILVSVRGVQSEEITVISDVKVGEEKEEDDYAISLYIVKEGETMWEVAKALNTDEKTLAEQNEEVALPLKGGEKILLYKGL